MTNWNFYYFTLLQYALQDTVKQYVFEPLWFRKIVILHTVRYYTETTIFTDFYCPNFGTWYKYNMVSVVHSSLRRRPVLCVYSIQFREFFFKTNTTVPYRTVVKKNKSFFYVVSATKEFSY